jgi:hypothetical protein
MSDQINPVQFGQMLAELAATREELARTRIQIDALTQRITDMEGHWSRGRASLAGLILGLGFAVLGVKQVFQSAWSLVRG